jgi:outer membrane protein
MKKFFLVSLVVSTFFFTEEIKSQKTWTLEECIKYALANNITIKRQELQTEIANNNYNQSKLDLLPDLSLGANHSIGKGRVADYSSFSYSSSISSGSLGLRSSIVVFSGLQKLNTIKMQQYNFLAMKEGLQKAKNDISLAIASAYLQILFNKELLEVTKSQLDVSVQQVEKTKKLFEVGNVAKGSLLEIQAQHAAEVASMTDAQNRLKISYLTLAQILDLDTVNNFSVSIPTDLSVVELFNENADSIYSLALQTMPQIRSAEYNLKSAKSQLSIARGGRLPSLSLSGDYYSQYNLDARRPIDITNPTVTEKYPVSEQLNDKLYKQLSINLSIPIFSKYQTQTRISNAKISKLDAEYALRQSQLTLRKEIEQAYSDAIASYENFKSRSEAASAQDENFKYVQQKFDVGMVNSIDYNIAKNNYTKAQSDMLQAKYQFIFNTKILDFYKGNPIKI